jgi:hypothetical protein
MTKGVLQLPLAFLNGSTTLDTANKALDDSFREVFKILGTIIFQDENKLTTTEDVGCFFAGMELYLSLSFLKDLESVVGDKSDIVGYIKSGKLRSKMNQTSLLQEDQGSFDELLQICQIIDGIITLSIAGIDYIALRSNIFTFEMMQKILAPYMLFMRMLCSVPVVVKHVQHATNTQNDKVYRDLAIAGDIFHEITLIMQIFQHVTYKYSYITTGTSSVYNIVTVMHLFSAIYENGSYCISVTVIPKDYFGHESQRKKDVQIARKLSTLVGAVFAAFLDMLSFNSMEENETPELALVNGIAVGGVIISAGVDLVLPITID